MGTRLVETGEWCFWKRWPDSDPDGNGIAIIIGYRFAGQYADEESGLRYNWNRYYDADKGQYVTFDPIGLAGELNSFGYIGGNPVNFFDPRGEINPVALALGVLAFVAAVNFMVDAYETDEEDVILD